MPYCLIRIPPSPVPLILIPDNSAVAFPLEDLAAGAAVLCITRFSCGNTSAVAAMSACHANARASVCAAIAAFQTLLMRDGKNTLVSRA
jgi:hypothetical protein